MSQDRETMALEKRARDLVYGDPDPSLTTEQWRCQVLDALQPLIERMKETGQDARKYHDLRAGFLRMMGRYSEALPDLFAQLNPDCHNRIILREIAEAYFAGNHYEQALEAITASIDTGESDAYEREIRGKILRVLGRIAEAEEDEQAVIEYRRVEANKWNDPDHYYSHK